MNSLDRGEIIGKKRRKRVLRCGYAYAAYLLPKP